MKLSIAVLLLVLISSCSCATITPEMNKIRSHEQYKTLTDDEKDIVEDIIEKASDSDRKDYYFKKLTLLLDTQTNSINKTRKLNRYKINKSIRESKKERRIIIKRRKSDLEEYLSQEEFYESSISRKWVGYSPKFSGPFFYVVDSDPLDILVHIKIRLHGEDNIISKIILLEDAIEKHLKVAGYSVNLVFIGYSDDEGDVFDVGVDIGRWTTSHNWVGSYKALAHELLHLMGLDDEYDGIEMHANNRNVIRIDRLYYFLHQMDEVFPADAAQGIMCFHRLKPLERHICKSVGLDDECTKARMKAFH